MFRIQQNQHGGTDRSIDIVAEHVRRLFYRSALWRLRFAVLVEGTDFLAASIFTQLEVFRLEPFYRTSLGVSNHDVDSHRLHLVGKL